MIYRFSEYTVEKLGILLSLEKIAIDIIEQFKIRKSFTFKTEIEGIPLIFECTYEYNNKEHASITPLHDNVFSNPNLHSEIMQVVIWLYKKYESWDYYYAREQAILKAIELCQKER